jgi:hypothetical protein
VPEDPRQTIIDAITGPAGQRSITGQSAGGVQSVLVRGGPLVPARAETIRFLKERRRGHHRLYAVSYTDQEGRLHLGYHAIAQAPDGSWRSSGGAGGSGNGPPRDRPWVNFAGWWGPQLFCAGGKVIGTDAELARRVDLVFSDETALEDTVEEGLVLFLEERSLAPPATARIFDERGALIAEHPALRAPARPPS